MQASGAASQFAEALTDALLRCAGRLGGAGITEDSRYKGNPERDTGHPHRSLARIRDHPAIAYTFTRKTQGCA